MKTTTIRVIVNMLGGLALFGQGTQPVPGSVPATLCKSPVFNDLIGSDPDCQFVNQWAADKPKPGHPSTGEKLAFIGCVSAAAIEAERQYSVPSAALVAMAVFESHYGFSRLALNTNNLFGFRYPQRDVPDDLKRRTFRRCPPDQNTLVDFSEFANYRQGVLFVARRLAEMTRYRPVTLTYSGIDPPRRCLADITDWVAGIGKAGFHSLEGDYLGSINRILTAEVDLPAGRAPLFTLSVASPDCGQARVRR